jgi:hypothetical protein
MAYPLIYQQHKGNTLKTVAEWTAESSRDFRYRLARFNGMLQSGPFPVACKSSAWEAGSDRLNAVYL